MSNLTAHPNHIHKLLSGFLKYDSFLERLVKVSEDFNKLAGSDDPNERKKIQQVQMCVLRCDFMIDWPTDSVKLVEYNTIASSFGILSQKVKQVQSYIKQKYGDQLTYNYEPINPKDHDEPESSIIEFGNSKMDTFLDSMVKNFDRAISEYKRTQKEKFGAESNDPWVLFVVEEKERNVIDQKIIETQL